jgi:hypothetical protein
MEKKVDLYSGTSVQYMNHRLGSRSICRGVTQNLPPRSPDLNPLDLYLWWAHGRSGVLASREKARYVAPAHRFWMQRF